MSGMFEYTEFSQFKHHLRDFLVQTKQFASQDNAELFAEEVQAQKQVCIDKFFGDCNMETFAATDIAGTAKSQAWTWLKCLVTGISFKYWVT